MTEYHILAFAQREKARLENRPEEAGRMQCYRCGRKIRDAEYLVDDYGMPRHFCCPVGGVK